MALFNTESLFQLKKRKDSVYSLLHFPIEPAEKILQRG